MRWFTKRHPGATGTPVTWATDLGGATAQEAISWTKTVENTDDFVPEAYTPAVTGPDPSGSTAWVVETIHRLADATALDDLTSDVLDGRLAALNAGWDRAADVHADVREHVTMRLAAAATQGIAHVQEQVARLRSEELALAEQVAYWTTQLTGEPAPAVPVASGQPLTLHLSSVVASMATTPTGEPGTPGSPAPHSSTTTKDR